MSEPYEGWAVLELMGHRVLVGRVSEVEMFGGKVCRIDALSVEAFSGVCGGERVWDHVCPEHQLTEKWVTQFYGVAAIYCLTPSDEQTIRARLTRAYLRPTYALVAPREEGDEPVDEDADGDELKGLPF